LWPSVCPPIRIISGAPIWRIFLKFDIGHFYENLGESPKLVKIGQKYRTLHMKVSAFLFFIFICFILFYIFAATLILHKSSLFD